MARVSSAESLPRPKPCSRTTRSAPTPSACSPSSRQRYPSPPRAANLPLLRTAPHPSISPLLQSLGLALSCSLLPPVVRYGLGMNQHAEQFRGILLKSDFKRRLHVVHSRKRHIVGQRAVAGNVKPIANPFELKLVDVTYFRKFPHHIAQPFLEPRLAHNLFAGFNRRRLALNVGENGRNLGDFRPHLSLQTGDFVMRLFHTELLIQFQMLFYVQFSCQILHADVMYVEVVVGRYRSNPVED